MRKISVDDACDIIMRGLHTINDFSDQGKVSAKASDKASDRISDVLTDPLTDISSDSASSSRTRQTKISDSKHCDSLGLAWLVTGASSSGKTRLLYKLVEKIAHDYGSHNVTAIVSHRLIADKANKEILKKIKVSYRTRLATTLSAFAFRIIEEYHFIHRLPHVRLINGAEQTSLLRAIFNRHTDHAYKGELCDTCMLLRSYFQGIYSNHTVQETATMFEKYITPVFLTQLRDMLARMNELGVSQQMEDRIIHSVMNNSDDCLPSQRHMRERFNVQIQLSYALRHEYAEEVKKQYPQEYRVDSSRLLREAHNILESEGHYKEQLTLPQVVIVDDAHELTVAGISLLQTLQRYGVHIILIGNTDESVLGFRGAYGEFLWQRACTHARYDEESCHDDTQACGRSEEKNFLPHDFARFGAQEIALSSLYDTVEALDYKALVESRIALNIPSSYATYQPIIERAQKFPDHIDHISRIYDTYAHNDVSPIHTTMQGDIFHSPIDEINFIVQSVMTKRIENNASWSDMAIIAHDNGTARALGLRLQNEGIPVQFSSIVKPLSEDPVTNGLFALIRLAYLSKNVHDTVSARKNTTSDESSEQNNANNTLSAQNESELSYSQSTEAINNTSLDSIISQILSSLRVYDMSPISDEKTHMKRLDSALNSICELSHVVRSMELETTAFDFDYVETAWKDLVETYGQNSNSYPLNVSALKVLLITDIYGVRSNIMKLVQSFYKDSTILDTLYNVIDNVNELDDHDILQVLWTVWDSLHIANTWQKKALDFSDFSQRLRYNELLDNAMRIFDYAHQKNSTMTITDFMRHVDSLEVPADSLAQVAGVDEAITVTTPASAIGKKWKDVWIPAVQQGTWPNMTIRNTLLGTDNLADLILTGHVRFDPYEHMKDVLQSEKRSFLFSLSRATQCVHISAVWNDDMTPSEFLYEYAPEIFHRVDSREKMNFTSVPLVDLADGEHNIRPMHIDDIIRQARVTLSEEVAQGHITDAGRDAISALQYLAHHGYSDADAKQWSFINDEDYCTKEKDACNASSYDMKNKNLSTGSKSDSDIADNISQSCVTPVEETTVSLSPSNVESIWGCPICYRLDKKFAGPSSFTAASTFGTLIHEVAQWASAEKKYDSEEFYNSAVEKMGSELAVIEYVTQELRDKYNSLRTEANIDNGAKEYLAEIKNNADADTIMSNIATYFIKSHNEQIAHNEKCHPVYKTLNTTQCEVEFSANITLEDIRFAYNAIEGRPALNAEEFAQLIDFLVEGMPEGFDYNTCVNLHGFIDRIENHTKPNDDYETLYIVDYKTGKNPHTTKEQNSNLQLVSYQLGIIFDNQGRSHGSDAERAEFFAHIPHIDMSVLFDVRSENIPGLSRKEGFYKYQPALFADSALASGEHGLRSYIKNYKQLWSDAPQGTPKNLSLSDKARERVMSEWDNRDNDCTLYTLSLIARVFYAGAVMQSDVIEAHTVHDSHNIAWCTYTDACALCAQKNNSVMEEWIS